MDLIFNFPRASLSYFGLTDVLTILFFAILTALILKHLKLSPIIGYIIAGAIIGPYGFNLSGYNNVTKSLAEFGVVFLLFSIGLELTLERVLAMRRLIFGLGLAQFIITSLVFFALAYSYSHNLPLAIVVGSSLSLSSTAVVLKFLSETRQSNTKTAKAAISVLLLQDLAVVPLFAVIPLLGSATEINVPSILTSMAIKSVIAFLIIFLFGRYLLRPVLHLIISSRYDDLFIAATLLVVLGAAWVTSNLGLSLAFGAFMAGVMVAETEFQHGIKTTIEPFKGIFLGFFFITEVGMHFDLHLAAKEFLGILLASFALITMKTILTLIICLLLRQKLANSLNTALLISQTGEFAFVLFEIAKKQNFVDDILFQQLSLVVGISMAVTPILGMIGQKLEKKLMTKKEDLETEIPISHNQILIAGFGRVGRTIAEILAHEGVNYIALDNNPKIVARYFKEKFPVYLGDISDFKFLESIKADDLAAIVITINEPNSAKKAVKLLNKHFPNLPLIVRAMDIEHFKILRKSGKATIVPEIQEVGLRIGRQVLTLLGESEENIKHIMAEFRTREINSFVKSQTEGK